jgi:hypothetical protein
LSRSRPTETAAKRGKAQHPPNKAHILLLRHHAENSVLQDDSATFHYYPVRLGITLNDRMAQSD